MCPLLDCINLLKMRALYESEKYSNSKPKIIGFFPYLNKYSLWLKILRPHADPLYAYVLKFVIFYSSGIYDSYFIDNS